uniref:Uncharacterized protein n=1 Tax=viral metagenome TaxID=1070528 RepID=A0A6C0I8Q6_9ZZZZ
MNTNNSMKNQTKKDVKPTYKDIVENKKCKANNVSLTCDECECVVILAEYIKVVDGISYCGACDPSPDEREEHAKKDLEEEEDEHEEVDDYDDEYGYYNRNGGDYKRPVVTINVAEMIEALNKLPPDAKLVMTETGYYSRREFARILLPKPYIVGTNKMGETDLPKGTQVYCIGHSHQTY